MMPETLTSTDPRARAREVAETRSTGAPVSIRNLPEGAQLVNVMGVDYIHTVTENGGDLYLTNEGFAHAEHLQPDNWYDLAWFRKHREVLEGTGAVYASPSKPIDGDCLVLVVKFSRVGQKVPIETKVIRDLLSCEFNGPFEEFALVEELRHSRRGPEGLMVKTQVPLAIYVPPDEWQPSQTGRFQWRIANKVAKHPGIAIDILRDYIMVYGWMPGIDVCQAEEMGWLSHEEVQGVSGPRYEARPRHRPGRESRSAHQTRRSGRVRNGRLRAPRTVPRIRARDHEGPPPLVPASSTGDEAGRRQR
jgi:hypothetical protein